MLELPCKYHNDEMLSIDGISLLELHRAFCETTYGRKLALSSRWSGFIPSGFTLSQWEGLLGTDVNNLHHNLLTVIQTQQFIDGFPEYFSPEERELMLLGAEIHDWGESIVGDINYHHKTPAHHIEEMKLLRGIVDEFCTDTPFEPLCPKMHASIDQVLCSTDTKLGNAFNAIERLGYITTGLNGWRMAQYVNGQSREQLIMLAQAPVKSQLAKLQQYAEVYPPVYAFLEHSENKDILQKIQSSFS